MNTEEKAFLFIKERSQYLNKKEIESYCNIPSGNLHRAITRNQKDIKGSVMLVKFLNDHFKGWENNIE